jgi:DNA-binding NarL/FixJ family response regulator
MARVLLADDHAMVRAGMRQFLEQDRGITEIGEAATGTETLDRLRASRWDLVILDINMPDRSGLDILRHIRAGYPDTKVLIVSGFPERQYAINLLKAGAGGYLSKDCAPEDLLRAARAVMQGRRYVSAELAEQLLADLEYSSDEPLHRRLSEREFQIFCKLATGRAVSSIAEELFLSVKTVSTYRTRILEKMSLVSNAELAAYALRNGLIP